jgi:hypothetical protein
VARLGDEEGRPGIEEGSSELTREGEEGREGQGQTTNDEELAQPGMAWRRDPQGGGTHTKMKVDEGCVRVRKREKQGFWLGLNRGRKGEEPAAGAEKCHQWPGAPAALRWHSRGA